jgi:endonuclease YncB( thermonuclease family)
MEIKDHMKKMGISRLCSAALLIIIILIIMFIPGISMPDESYGVVTNIVDGSTFDVDMGKADSRTANSTERIVLADIKSAGLNSSEGFQARDLAAAILLDRRIFLDIDNLGDERDSKGRLVSVVYLSGLYGQPILSPSFNRILVDSGLAQVNDSKENEFNPGDWWSGTSGSQSIYDDTAKAAVNHMEKFAKQSLGTIQGELGKEYENRSKEAGSWLRQQLITK